jgi:hypothetical protein
LKSGKFGSVGRFLLDFVELGFEAEYLVVEDGNWRSGGIILG